jgi:N-methylhydantoinase B/oxoprolinase/acetone carboxylase alpha subunit
MELVDRQTTVFDDPISFEIIRGRLVTVADEMQTTLRRIAFSTIVGAANDLGCDILDARGWLVAHATTSNPAFNLTCTHLVQKLVALFPSGGLEPGDVLITNDPWLVCGHLPDFGIVTPIFRGDELVGFTGSIAHVADIGGVLNGSLSNSIYEEGLQVPPMKLYTAGVRNDTLVSLIEKNVRTPEMVMGDLNAMVAANALAAEQTIALLDAYGLTTLEPLSDIFQTRSARAMRHAIGEIPDGDYAAEIELDELDGPLRIGLVLRVRDTEIEVDLVDVPPEHPQGGINCCLSYTIARVTYTLNALLTPELSSSQGLFRPITIRVPEGSILNARYPANVNDRTKTGFHITELIEIALAQALPDRVPSPGAFSCLIEMRGQDDNTVQFNSFVFCGGGMGAGSVTDGADATIFPTSSCNVPIEITEAATGMHVLEKEYVLDSGGAGRLRGGCGVRLTVAAPDDLAQPVIIGIAAHNQEYPPQGLFGGQSGKPTRVRLNGELVPTHEVGAKLAAYELSDPAVRITLETGGGGGFGPPSQRDPSKVLADVRSGLVSPHAAEEEYGVIMDLEQLKAARKCQ